MLSDLPVKGLWEQDGMVQVHQGKLWDLLQLYSIDKRNIRAARTLPKEEIAEKLKAGSIDEATAKDLAEDRSSFKTWYKENDLRPGDIVREIEASPQGKAIVQAHGELQKFFSDVLKYLVDTGVISQAKHAEWTSHGDYIQFYRQLETLMTEDRTYAGQSIGPVMGGKNLTSRLNPIKKMHGSDDEVIGDFFENFSRYVGAAVDCGMRNVAAQRAIADAVLIGIAEKVEKATRKQYREGSIVTIRVNGEDQRYVFKDSFEGRMTLDALAALDGSPLTGVLRMLEVPRNILRAFTTHFPGFIFVAHPLREGVQSWVVSPNSTIPIVNAITGFGHVMAQDEHYRALIGSGGGPVQYGGVFDFGTPASKALAAKAKSELARKDWNPTTTAGKWMKAVSDGWHKYERCIEAADLGTRITLYEAELAHSGSEAEAAYAAQAQAIRYTRHGSSAGVRLLAATIPFINARWQGADLVTRAALGKSGFNARQVWLRLFALGGLSTALTLMTMGTKEYENAPEETKDTNYIIPIAPGINIEIPVPFEAGTLSHTFPLRLIRWFKGVDHWSDTKAALGRALGNTLPGLPIPGVWDPALLVPQAIRPLYDVAVNKSALSGAPIESKTLERFPVEERYGISTSEVAKGISHQLGGMMSPAKIDYILKGYFGTMGNVALADLDAAVHAGNPGATATLPARIDDLPFLGKIIDLPIVGPIAGNLVGRIVKDPRFRYAPSVEQFYNLKTELEEYSAVMKARPETAPTYMQNRRYQLLKSWSTMDGPYGLPAMVKDLGDLKKAYSQQLSAPDHSVPPEIRAQLLRVYIAQINNVTNRIGYVRKALEP